jgi:CO dehydrogenase/acetyl-CoA synthase gamma subunit (corrinoid Fe-S protein)
MKLSIEAKVAAAVAAAFIALTLGAIAQGNSRDQTGAPNGYGLADSPRINTYISQEEIE